MAFARRPLERRRRGPDRWCGERRRRPLARLGQPLANAAIRQYPQLRGLDLIRRRRSDARHGTRGRTAMNLLTEVLFLPLVAFLIALFIPRSATGASRLWALISSVAI